MTPREKVLAVWPDAYSTRGSGVWIVRCHRMAISYIGSGPTESAAWSNTAARMEAESTKTEDWRVETLCARLRAPQMPPRANEAADMLEALLARAKAAEDHADEENEQSAIYDGALGEARATIASLQEALAPFASLTIVHPTANRDVERAREALRASRKGEE